MACAEIQFTLPSDEEVFRMRETEKQRKEEEKSKNSRLKIYDKTTASSKIGNIRRFRSDDAVRQHSEQQLMHLNIVLGMVLFFVGR
ncbi:hypothetical protein F441_04544 [Phytophthora nicotianae CJ01A1]|uniref:Uncharacterized protein n=6 Tax=Phytophthora nicotianae TaxID=4792 RepID=W2QIY1_PHYN3|nr:hypothetical protein PPTG_22422 [Phytophthora nicotianae INRA-310]ETI52256.1 hypothetical protein F443_04572 [Phytophthora nicotianae P1569]ETN12831.1 hypothetical protein PPTG_22422 [Phytophthora nicotianae INRA-310]ETP22076.1 hypothetical protein F441_04544 [Phytophthora nicotianae CJ01A1]ETP49979.1 hypothetical protein F442_04616 [Phytophthora nicotianae P10297]